MKVHKARKRYVCYKCQKQIDKDEPYTRIYSGATVHEQCYDTNKKKGAIHLETAQERKYMSTHMYTLNEITDALRHMMQENDSLEYHLKGGDFRRQFDRLVSLNRAKQSTGEFTDLRDRIVSTTVDGEEVYLLDDIQGALNKQQFAEFMTFLHTSQVDISVDDESYVLAGVVDLFLTATTGTTVEPDSEPSVLKFA